MSNEIDIKRMTLVDPNYSGRRVEVGFEYLKNFFSSQSDFLGFLEKLDSKKREKILHSGHFYWVHDVFRNCKISKNRPLDIFSVLTTFSIAEFLMAEPTSWGRINNFFNNYLELKEIQYMNNKVQARKIKGKANKKNAIRILYDMRNEFIHNAQWFYLHNAAGFATIDKIVERSGNYYMAVIKLNHKEYLDLFWKAFLRFFSYKI